MDPNWLPSTTAQATAALVAIVGGLLASRLVSLSSERTTLQRQLRMLITQQCRLNEQLEVVHRERVQVSQDWFREAHLERIVRERGMWTADELVSDFLPRGASVDEMTEYASTLMGLVDDAFLEINRVYNDVQFPIPDPKQLRADGVDAPTSDEGDEVLAVVAAHIASQRRVAFGFDPSFVAMRQLSDQHVQRQDQRILQETDLVGRIRDIAASTDLVTSELEGVRRPQGVWSTLVSLAIFALLGIAFPLVVMTIRPVPDSAGVRIGLLLAFLVGLSGLCFVFALNLVRLRRAR